MRMIFSIAIGIAASFWCDYVHISEWWSGILILYYTFGLIHARCDP